MTRKARLRLLVVLCALLGAALWWIQARRQAADDGQRTTLEFPPVPREALAKLELGCTVDASGNARFALFAPRAKAVHIVASFNDWDPSSDPMVRDEHGVWHLRRMVEPGHRVRYRFLVDGARRIVDPYAQAVDGESGDSLLCQPRSAEPFVRVPRDQLVIYELHVGDFTSDVSSGLPDAQRGTYQGLIEKIPYLRSLGVNAVQLMPITESTRPGYQWGYDSHYRFAPTARYASGSVGEQVDEFARLVAALHASDIAVLLDVNFTYMGGQTGESPLWDVDREYYFDAKGDGGVRDDLLPWGYRLAIERPFVQKYIRDACVHWMAAYGVDGFRFDATRHSNAGILLKIVESLLAEGYEDRYYVFEEFSGPHNHQIQQFNARLGRGVVSSWAGAFRNAVWGALLYGTDSQQSLGVATHHSADEGWQYAEAVVNYFGSHDEGTLTGHFGAPKHEVMLALTHLLTSMGVPLLWSGEELARVHHGNHHPDGPRKVMDPASNRFDWSRARTQADLRHFASALIRLRRDHPALRLAGTGPSKGAITWWPLDWNSALGYVLTSPDDEHAFLVLLNYRRESAPFSGTLPIEGTWQLVADGRSARVESPGLGGLEVGDQALTIEVPARSAHIYRSPPVRR